MRIVPASVTEPSTAAKKMLILYTPALAGLLLVVWLGLNVLHTWERMAAYYNMLPVWDYWRVVDDYLELQKLHFAPLWKQHNEHRIFVPEMVFLADMFWWHGRQFLPTILNFICYAGTWVLLWSAVWGDRTIARSSAFLSGALAGVVVLWEGSALVLAVPFLLVWQTVLSSLALALVCVSKARGPHSMPYLAGAIAGGSVATYSEANGLTIWPLLLAIAFVLRLRRSQLTTLTVAAVLNIGVYFAGYQSTGSLNLRQLAGSPGYSLGFVASYLSMPFGGMGGTAGGLLWGGVLLAGTMLCAAMAAQRGWWREHAFVVLCGFIGFGVLTALLTAAGRMNPADHTFGAAKAVRYLTVPESMWGAFLMLVLWTASRVNQRRALAVVAWVVAAALWFYLPKLKPWLTVNSEPFAEAQLAALSVEDNSADLQLAVRYLYPDWHVLQVLLAGLRASNKSLFYHGRDKWLGQPASRFAPARPAINGAVTGAYPLSAGVQVTGWADDAEMRKPYTWVVLTDEDRNIAGFGRRFEAGFPESALAPATPASLAWTAYIPLRFAGRRIQAYVVDPRVFGLMPISEGSYRVPTVSAADARLASALIEGVGWQRQGEGNGDPSPSGLKSGSAPAGPIAGTYGGGDGFVGTVRSTPIARPANGCLVIPVVTGPRVQGLSAAVVNAATGMTAEPLPLRNGRDQWSYWRVQIAPGVAQVMLVADDEGRDWGQWIAMGAPYACP